MRKKSVKTLVGQMLMDSVDHAFVLTAIERYCQTVLADESDWGDKSLINQDLWKVVAKGNLDLIKDYYK